MVYILNLFLAAGSANLALSLRKVEVTLQKIGGYNTVAHWLYRFLEGKKTSHF